MDLRTLQYFVVVAEELNITKAAEKLHMSQPPLSAQIKKLELELNTELFIRGKRQLDLTESGELLYRRAKEILRMVEKTKTEILSLSDGMRGTISIGLVEGIAPDIAAEWCSGFIERYPHIRFRILDGSTDDLLEKLRSGIISLAVITSKTGRLDEQRSPVGPEGRQDDQNLRSGRRESHRAEQESDDRDHPQMVQEDRRGAEDRLRNGQLSRRGSPCATAGRDQYFPENGEHPQRFPGLQGNLGKR